MIAKTSIGRSFKGCCGYNMEKVEKGKGEVLMSQGVRDYDQKAMVADFTRQAKMHPELTRSVWHTAVSFSPADEARLQTEPGLMEQVAGDYLRGMGLEESQYVVIRHRDTGHSHFHIVANRVRTDGQVVSDGHNFSRSEKLLRQIEKTYGLTPMMEQAQRTALKHVPERDRQRIAMRDQVRACVVGSTNEDELRQVLGKQGIHMAIQLDQAGQPRGVIFEQTQEDNGVKKTVAFKGSKLHQSLGVAQVYQQLALNEQQHQQKPHKPAQEPRIIPKPAILNQPEIELEIKRNRGQGRSL